MDHPARALRRHDGLSAVASLARHWPEYLMEVAEPGLYMFATCVIAALLQHPASPVRHLILNPLARRELMGIAMGLTIVAIVLSPWGKQSGGHLNPAITLTFYRLGKVEFWDLWFYILAQFVGAVGGVCIARYALWGALGDHAVHYAVTVPGVFGTGIAFAAELTISFLFMITILVATNRARLAPYTPYLAGALIAIYIAFETPLSGMSTNPARTFGSALHANYWQALWIYFLAPTLGMLGAGEVFLRSRGGVPPFCAKLHHVNNKRCIFHHA
ncbi:MAG TPA: aquaporin [Terriglobales bacterium]|nr:aquaporin [Terriglobales bacterium]